MKDQSELIRKWIDTPNSSLILFDAGRYDVFKELYPEYFEGELVKASSGVSYTPDWFMENFDGEYKNITLYNAAPLRKMGPENYNAHKHFRVVYWDKFDWDEEKGTTPPKKVNKVVFRDNWKGKKLIRYFQPHPPFINEPHLEWTKGSGRIQRAKRKYENGELDLERFRKAYKSNMRLSFEGAVELQKELDENLIITADHGEALGEKNLFFHGRSFPQIPALDEVPWFKIKEVV